MTWGFLLLGAVLARAQDDYILRKLDRAITRHEHCIRWNNPGCLVFSGQPAAVRLPGGYARFATMRDGARALLRDLRAKLRRGMTVERIMVAWNGGLYLETLLRETGLRREASWVH
jgi:hypothetical protein